MQQCSFVRYRDGQKLFDLGVKIYVIFQSRSVDLKWIRKAAKDAKFEFNEIQIHLRVKTEVSEFKKFFIIHFYH